MRVAVLTANLGAIDEPPVHVPQVGEHVVHYFPFSSHNLPPRPKALSLRLQSKIPKMFGWDLVPGYDFYLWHDSSLWLSQPDSVSWFVSQLGDQDIAVFTHPWRFSIAEEAAFIQMKADEGSPYILSRYEGEDLKGQMAAITAHPVYVDDHLFAAGAFCYRPTRVFQDAMKEWWYHTTRFHCIDQLSYPFALGVCGVPLVVIHEDIYHASHLHWHNHRKRPR